MLHDFLEAIPGVTVAGLEISDYGIAHTMENVRPFVVKGSCEKLPFPDKSFDLVLAINTIHNLKGEPLMSSLREMERVSRKHKFLVVDAFETDEERDRIMKWVLTAETVVHAREWEALFQEARYTGDYFWFTP